MTQGPIRAEWLFEPCSKLGGDAFGYGPIAGGKFVIYNLDVSGHGAGAAMHSVAVMNLLRQRALPNTDVNDPVQVTDGVEPAASHGRSFLHVFHAFLVRHL